MISIICSPLTRLPRAERSACASVGPGEVGGEVGFFTSDRRRSATVTAATDGQVRVVRRRWLDELRGSDPRAAADVLFQLARTLADRVQ